MADPRPLRAYPNHRLIVLAGGRPDERRKPYPVKVIMKDGAITHQGDSDGEVPR